MAMAVERALISVFDKTGIAEFAKRLAALRIEILSTGGTARVLRDAGVAVRDVSEFTGWPEMLGGRVKTLHPKVHGGLLFRRNHAEDKQQAAEHGIAPIDLVVVNLYPFEATAAKASASAEELIENIDIGGPAMLRSAAKNFESVTVVTDPQDYERVAAELESSRETTLITRLELARKVYATTSRYDGVITMELERLSAAAGRLELGAKPLLPERRSFDYTRHGTIDLFAALNTATGKVIGQLSAQHRAIDFRDFLDETDRQTEPGLAIHVICDNLSAHKAPVVHKWLLANPRVQLHFTPTYSSWISQVERWFAELQRRCLDRGVFCSLDELTTALEDWIKIWNATARPFKWTKTADQIIDRICRYCSRISGPGH
jgi:transposase